MLTNIAMNSTNVRNAMSLLRHRAQVAFTAAVAPDKSVDTAARLFTTPPRIPHTARELELLAAHDVVDFIAERVVFAPPPQHGHARTFGAPAPIL